MWNALKTTFPATEEKQYTKRQSCQVVVSEQDDVLLSQLNPKMITATTTQQYVAVPQNYKYLPIILRYKKAFATATPSR